MDITDVHVAVIAPSECGDAPAFASNVQRRTSKVRITNDAKLRFEVRVKKNGDVYVGTIAEEGDDAPPRPFDGADCNVVMDALALSFAMSLDPDAGMEKPQPPPPKPQPPSPKTIAPTPSPLPEQPGMAIGMGVTVTGFLFEPMIGGALSFERVLSRAPEASLRLRFVGMTEASQPASRPAHVSVGYVAFDLCVGALRAGTVLAIRPCLGIEPGFAYAAGQGDLHASVAMLMTASFGLQADIALGRSWGLLLEASGLVSLIRPRFYTEPSGQVVVEAGYGGAFGGVSLRYRF